MDKVIYSTDQISRELIQLNEFIEQKPNQIQSWINKKADGKLYTLYNSVDIRFSGFKISPVDTNIFPAGFHLLTQEDRKEASLEFKKYIEKLNPEATKLLIIPENFTRNEYYFQNVNVLTQILKGAGYDVRVGSGVLSDDVNTMNHSTAEQLTIKDNKLIVQSDGYCPQVIILNNDLTSGVPEILQNIQQPIIPDIKYGWYNRTKYKHLISYNKIADEFCEYFGLDSWYIKTNLLECTNLNFKEQKSLEFLRQKIGSFLEQLINEYAKRGITQTPYAFIKANQGTFGMGVMSTENMSDKFLFNKKSRNSMFAIKEGRRNEQIIIQEGIKTIITLDNYPAESLFYFVNGKNVGHIIRYNKQKNQMTNLNSSGMFFSNENERKNKIPLYNLHLLIATLAVLAVPHEEIIW